MDSARDARVGQLVLEKGLLAPGALEALLAERARDGGGDFEQFLRRRGALTEEQAASISRELAIAPTLQAPSTPSSASEFTRRLERLQSRPDRTFPGRYSVSGELARGGMGSILDARDLDLRRDLVIKVMLSGGAAEAARVAKFVEEAQVQGQLEHPNICPVHELGVDDQGRLYFTMKKVKGRSLAEVLRAERERPSPGGSLNRLLEVHSKVCDAVAFAHSRGVIHRDLKPENIMIGEFGEVLVMDWGLAKLLGKGERAGGAAVASDRADEAGLRSMDGAVMGTPAYMPPEQARGEIEKVDERSDIYALGGLLYAILVLEAPVTGPDVGEILRRVSCHEIVPPSKRAPGRRIPADLEAAAMKALAFRREDRYATVGEFQRDIRAFLEGRALAAAEYTLLELAGKWVRRNRVFALTASAAALLLVLGTGLYVADVTRAQRRAEENARRAELRTAEALIAQGDALGMAGDWREARSRYAEAREAAPFAADLGMLHADRESPPALLVMSGHAGAVNAVAFSPDGRRAVSGGDDRTLREWDVRTGRLLRTISQKTPVPLAVAFSDDGKELLSGNNDATFRRWGADDAKPLRTGRSDVLALSVVSFSPDGRRALAGSFDNTLRIWDMEALRPAGYFRGHAGGVTAVAISGDGTRVLSGGSDGALKLWAVGPGSELRAFPPHGAAVVAVALSPDGRRAASASLDGALRLWDAEAAGEFRALAGHASSVKCAAFSPDGRFLLTGSRDRMLRLWDARSGQPLRVYAGHAGDVNRAAFSPDGRFLVSAGADRTIRLWETAPPRDLPLYAGHAGPVRSVQLSPDGLVGLSAGEDGTLRVWDVATGRPFRTLKGHAGPVQAASFSPDPRLALTGGKDGWLKLWDLLEGRETGTWEAHFGGVTSLAYLDGRRAVTAGDDGTLKLWDLESGKAVRTLAGHEGTVYAVATDGRVSLSAGYDKTVRVWSLETGASTVLAGHGNRVRCVSVSRDGRRALSGGHDETVRLWDLAAGKEARAFTGHGLAVTGVAFSPDGRHAISCGNDGTLRLWDLGTGSEVRAFSEFPATVNAVSFREDGRAIFLGTGSGGIRLLDFTRPARAAGAPLADLYALRGLHDRAVELGLSDPLARMRSLWLAGDREGAGRALLEVKGLPDYYRVLLETELRR